MQYYPKIKQIQLKIIKLHFVLDANGKLSQQRFKFLKKLKNYSPQKADLIVVLGGDGFTFIPYLDRWELFYYFER